LEGAEECIFLLGVEERTPDRQEKIDMIMSQFIGKFKQLMIVVHPYGVEGEIPGKCSNSNWA
jgi:hypothetical protein